MRLETPIGAILRCSIPYKAILAFSLQTRFNTNAEWETIEPNLQKIPKKKSSNQNPPKNEVHSSSGWPQRYFFLYKCASHSIGNMDGETKHALQCRTAVEYAKAIVQRFLHYPGLTFISGICQLSCGQHQSRTKVDIKSVPVQHVWTSDLQDRNGEVMHKIKKMRLNQKGENCKKNKKLLAEANFCQRRQRNLDV